MLWGPLIIKGLRGKKNQETMFCVFSLPYFILANSSGFSYIIAKQMNYILFISVPVLNVYQVKAYKQTSNNNNYSNNFGNAHSSEIR